VAGGHPDHGQPAKSDVHQHECHALARYGALCQKQGLVPIVEPEVLMDGSHTIERCDEVTGLVLHEVFHRLHEQHVSLEGMLLKANMVISRKGCARQAPVEEVAAVTLRCLRRHVPVAMPGIVFLSGGQTTVSATAHLNAMNTPDLPKPWVLSFSYGRALQDPRWKPGRARRKTSKRHKRRFISGRNVTARRHWVGTAVPWNRD